MPNLGGFFTVAQTGHPCWLSLAQSEWMSITGSSSAESWTPSRSSWTWTSSVQSVGGPRADDTGGGSTGSPTCARCRWCAPAAAATSGLLCDSGVAAWVAVRVHHSLPGVADRHRGRVVAGVIRREHAVIAMPVFSGWRHEIGEPRSSCGDRLTTPCS